MTTPPMAMSSECVGEDETDGNPLTVTHAVSFDFFLGSCAAGA